MLNFEDSFFSPEIREDFRIDATMKTVWAAELEVLSEIAKVCERHGLTWHMAFGALLGVIRHQGYVPWDDDIDILLSREDYMQLLTYLPQELPEGYVVKSPMLETGYPEFHSNVMNSDSISIAPEHLQKFHGCPFIVGVDIFPLDRLADTAQETLQLSLFKTARQGALMVKEGKAGEELDGILSILERQCDVTIERTYLEHPDSVQAKEELTAGLWGLANEIAMMDNDKDTDKLVMYLDYFRYRKVYKAEWFQETVWMPFEGFQVPVPAGYDQILRVVYGDYTLRIRGGMHDYPFYKKQLEQLRRHVAEVESANKRGESC